MGLAPAYKLPATELKKSRWAKLPLIAAALKNSSNFPARLFKKKAKDGAEADPWHVC
jgi:hypothetical protein